MGFWKGLLQRTPPEDEPRFVGDFLEIPSRGFMGWFARSPNGRYVLGWMDANKAGEGGARTGGKGRYVLLDGTGVIAEGRIERPNDGKVADNGNFVLNDWRLDEGLCGTFYAFRRDGAGILSATFRANLYNNGLSSDGTMAVCQTCNSPDGDSSVLAVFDLAQGCEVGRWVPESGWAQSYDFAADWSVVRLCYEDGVSFAYTPQGLFLDRERWIGWALRRGNLSVVDRLMQEAGDNLSVELAEKLVAATGVALDSEHNRDWALKMRGICLEALGRNAEALGCFEEALRLNPKIGVKRRAAALRR